MSFTRDLSGSFRAESPAARSRAQQATQRAFLQRLKTAQRAEERAKAKAARATQREMAAECALSERDLLLSELRAEVTRLSASEEAQRAKLHRLLAARTSSNVDINNNETVAALKKTIKNLTAEKNALDAEKRAVVAERGESVDMLAQLEAAVAEQQDELNVAHAATAARDATIQELRAAEVATAAAAHEKTRQMKAAHSKELEQAASAHAAAVAAHTEAANECEAKLARLIAKHASELDALRATPINKGDSSEGAMQALQAANTELALRSVELTKQFEAQKAAMASERSDTLAELESMRIRLRDSEATAAAANLRIEKLQTQQRALLATQRSEAAATASDPTASLLAMVTRSPASTRGIKQTSKQRRASITAVRQGAFRLGMQMQKKLQLQKRERFPKGIEDNADIVLFSAVGFIMSMAYASFWIVNNADTFGAIFGI